MYLTHLKLFFNKKNQVMKPILNKSICLLLMICSFLQLYAQNPSTINGSITMSEETLSALSVQHGQNLFSTGMGFEVWNVVYRDVLSREGVQFTRVYLNQKVPFVTITPAIGLVGGQKNIIYTVSNIPPQGDFILLYYFNAYPPQFKFFKAGSKLEDGSKRTALRYATNAPLKIGQGKEYGAISILAARQNPNYTTTVQSNTTAVAAFGLGDIFDFFEDLASAVWEGGKTLAGVVVDATGTIIVQAYGIGQALVTDDGVIIPRYREITPAEYNWANGKIFNGNLPPKDRIIITNLLGFQKRAFVWPTGAGKILMNLGKQGYDNPQNLHLDKGCKQGQVFTHELTHVWQIHHTADISFTLNGLRTQLCDLLGNNAYQVDCGKSWGQYNIEQQATLCDRCFKAREGGTQNTCQESYVEANIRKGVNFPNLRSPECQNLINQIAAKAQELKNRADAILAERKRNGLAIESLNTINPLTGKPMRIESVPPAILNADAQYVRIKNELAALNQQKAATNCE